MRIRYWLIPGVVAIGVLTAAGVTYPTWRGKLFPPAGPAAAAGPDHEDEEPDHVHLSPQARGNLGLVVKPVQPSDYWRTLPIPGVLIDRPGHCDVTVPAPLPGVVQDIAVVPGRLVSTGDELLTLRLNSEPLRQSQAELFRTTQDLMITQEQKERLVGLARTGAIPEARLIELANQERRLQAQIQSLRFDLAARGIPESRLEGIAGGQFISEIKVAVPARRLTEYSQSDSRPPVLEVQKLNVQLGEQVQAGQPLYLLHDPYHLYVEGHAFPRDAACIERALQNGAPVQADFQEGEALPWPPLTQELRIEYLAATMDPASRTLSFFVPVLNQWREYAAGDRPLRVWRFRPGQRVRLFVPVDLLRGVAVLPPAAVVREGPDAYVFRKGPEEDELERVAVHVRHEDSRAVVVAFDDNLKPGQEIAHNGAAALNRILKAQAGGEGHDHHHDHDH